MCVAGVFVYPNVFGRALSQRTESGVILRYEVGWPMVYQWSSSYTEDNGHPEVYISPPDNMRNGRERCDWPDGDGGFLGVV